MDREREKLREVHELSPEHRALSQSLEGLRIESVLKDYGLSSTEFYLKVRSLIALVLHRHFKSTSEEHFQDALREAYTAILEVMTEKPYNPKKNLRNYLYTIARNSCSTYAYRDKRSRNREPYIDDILDGAEANQTLFCEEAREPVSANYDDLRPARSRLGAYTFEVAEAFGRLASGEAVLDEVATSLCPFGREALRVRLWKDVTEGCLG